MSLIIISCKFPIHFLYALCTVMCTTMAIQNKKSFTPKKKFMIFGMTLALIARQFYDILGVFVDRQRKFQRSRWIFDMSLLEPPQHDDFRLSFNWTGRVKSIVSLLLTFALWSIFFHWRTAITKAAETFCDVFADVSIKLITWNSSHQLRTSSCVISRSLAATSF